MERVVRVLVTSMVVMLALVAGASRARAQSSFVVRGTVRAAPTQPGIAVRADAGVGGVRIVFERTAGAGAVPAPVVTGDSGGFTAGGFDAGSRYLARPQRVGLVFEPASRPVVAGTSLDFVVTGLRATAPPPPARFRASGRVGTRTRGTGLAKVRLTFTRDGGGRAPDPVETDLHGDWSQEGFDPGSVYRITPSRGLLTFDPPSLELRGAAGEQVRDVDVDVPDTFTLTGTLRNAAGRALRGVIQAKVPLTFGELHCATVAADGSFRLEGLRTGQDYVVEPIYREGLLFSFSPGSVRLDGPDAVLRFTGRPDRTIVSETRSGNTCPRP